MIKLVTIDLDGTLFDNNKIISEENKLAIKLAKEHGCKIVIATGRPISGAMKVLNELGLNTDEDYAIIYNGAKVFNVGTKEIIYSSTISYNDVIDLYKESKRLNVYFHAFKENEELITDIHNPYTDVEATLNNIKDNIVDFNKLNPDERFLKAMMVDSDENVTRCINEINPHFYTTYSMVRSAKIFLEFLDINTHKGNGLIQLAKYLNIDIKDTMAIGDAGNDLPMIKVAGIGVAMENSFPEIKKYADYITSSNECSGVADAINKFVLNKN